MLYQCGLASIWENFYKIKRLRSVNEARHKCRVRLQIKFGCVFLLYAVNSLYGDCQPGRWGKAKAALGGRFCRQAPAFGSSCQDIKCGRSSRFPPVLIP